MQQNSYRARPAGAYISRVLIAKRGPRKAPQQKSTGASQWRENPGLKEHTHVLVVQRLRARRILCRPDPQIPLGYSTIAGQQAPLGAPTCLLVLCPHHTCSHACTHTRPERPTLYYRAASMPMCAPPEIGYVGRYVACLARPPPATMALLAPFLIVQCLNRHALTQRQHAPHKAWNGKS